MKHYDIIVSGKVQGVFYRASACDKARDLGVKGWVMNKADGTVYIEAEGEREVLDQLINWCKQGPPRSKVEKVQVEVGEPKGFKGFEIRY